MTGTEPRGIAVLSPDPAFQEAVARALQGDGRFRLLPIALAPSAAEAELRRIAPAAAIADVGAGGEAELDGLRRCVRALGSVPVVVVVDAMNAEAARTCVRLRLADLLVKPVPGADLVAAIGRAFGEDETEVADSRIHAFLPATGGAGNTTLALQTAFLLHGEAVRQRKSTCVVDLNLQHGACAEYLDLEPRFDIADIENRPDRLDRQLLEAMLSRHASGLAVISAPPCPWEMRSFRADLVTRLLDLASSYFDNVVIDLPRTWFPWTDSILNGSDRVFVVTEATVPAIRHSQRLTRAIQERLGPQAPVGVIVNRFDARSGSEVSEADLKAVLGETYAGRVANDWRVVRQALDRGVPVRDVAPGCEVLRDLERIVLPEQARTPEPRSLATAALRLFGARRLAAAR